MSAKIISLASGTALLALTAIASAGPVGVSNSQIIAPQAPTQRVDYAYPYYAYGGGSGMATLAGTPMPASGDFCATPIRTCLLREPGWLGTGCSCRVPGGIARGAVVE